MAESRQPRRLKLMSYGYTDISDKRLLDLRYCDRWGNQYRWTPEWDDTWDLFIEALQTEMSNKPDSGWAQVFQDLAGIAIARMASGKGAPNYPKRVEKLIEKVYLGAYLDEHYQGDDVRKNVRLGPVELHFKKQGGT